MSLKNKDKMQVEKQPEPKKLLKSLFQQRINQTFCDVQLQLQDTVIWGHACVLASCSSYFMKCLQPSCVEESNSENHWCSKKPLIIELVKVMSDPECHCPICVSKIIDFMYLREIVVIKGHFQHFCKIANFLKVFDLLPLCQKYFAKINSAANIKSEQNIEQVVKNTSKINSNNKITEAECVSKETSENQVRSNSLENQREISFTNKIHKLSSNEVEITSSNIDVTKERNFTNKIAENQIAKKSVEAKLKKMELSVPSNSPCSNNKIELEVVKSNNESDGDKRQKCKYVCCNTDTNTSSATGTKPIKRRKLTCELCNHSSVSLQKILQHIESTNHFGTLCPICNRQTNSVNDFKEHLKDHVDPKPYICYICKKRNRHWEYHKLHLKTHCKNKEFECKVCKKRFKRHYSLKAHLTTHNKKYLCKKCDYLTSDLKMFKSHVIQHSEDNLKNCFAGTMSDDKIRSIFDNELKKRIIEKQFHCQVCGEGFTQKKNLIRHIQLKHFSVTEYRCSKCMYTTKRTDLLRHHMRKYHDCLPVEADVKKWKEKKKPLKKTQKPEKALQNSNILGVLIPVELISTIDKSTLNAFAVKTCVNKGLENKEIAHCIESNIVKNQNNNSSGIIITNKTKLCEPHRQKCSDQGISEESKLSIADIGNTDSSTILTNVSESKIDSCDEKINNMNSLSSINKECVKLGLDIQRTHEKEVNNLVVNFSANIPNCFNTSTDLTETFNEVYAGSQELKSLHLAIDKECNESIKDTEKTFLDSNEHIWLNEATGELLSGNNFMGLHIIDADCTVDPNEQLKTAPCKPSLDFSDPFQTLILNERVSGLSVFDLGDDADDWHSNPQTPQTNLVELDDPENLFNWNCLDNSFCSTWVLNETTGELNLASFSVQPLKNSDELKLDENTGTFSSIDDDNTALFLNEGTGDLSVIYLNSRPNTRDCNSPMTLFNENLSQENIETLSEHSNDDDDLLNEEFLMASASFMAHEENETFLNELTGEFDIANLNTYQPGLQPNQMTGNESVYLNEETGEISWNVLDNNLKRDLFTNTDSLRCEFDDSLNCEEYDPFTTEMDDFSSQFCLENSISNDYYTVDENRDTLLNECTGELVKKT